MSEPHEQEVPTVTDVPEPDQEPHEPIPDEADDGGEREAHEAGELEPEPEPEPEAQGPTPEQIEKVWKATDRAVEGYVKKISQIWEESGLALTPFGLDPAAPLGFVNMDNAGRIDAETKDAALQFLGFAREKPYQADPETSECHTCKGEGLTATGSKVAQNMTRDCPTCHGLGYEGGETAQGNGVARVSSHHAPASEQSGPLDSSDVDNWGEPRILPDGSRNENFGKMPQYKQPHPVYGDTRNLTAQDAVS